MSLHKVAEAIVIARSLLDIFEARLVVDVAELLSALEDIVGDKRPRVLPVRLAPGTALAATPWCEMGLVDLKRFTAVLNFCTLSVCECV